MPGLWIICTRAHPPPEPNHELCTYKYNNTGDSHLIRYIFHSTTKWQQQSKRHKVATRRRRIKWADWSPCYQSPSTRWDAHRQRRIFLPASVLFVFIYWNSHWRRCVAWLIIVGMGEREREGEVHFRGTSFDQLLVVNNTGLLRSMRLLINLLSRVLLIN